MTVTGIANRPGAAFYIFRLLAEKNISVDIILGSKNGEIDFTVSTKDLKTAIDTLNRNSTLIDAEGIAANDGFSKISVIGAGLETNPGVVASLLDAVMDAGINIELITTSEIKISMLVAEADTEKAVRALHKKFIE